MPHAQRYPFSAVVGSDDMALALVLTTIAPSVGGVLVRGEKGTAKSTMVRALAAVQPPIRVFAGDRFSVDPAESDPATPDGPVPAGTAIEERPVRLVELPVGATEDRVLGSLHLEKALTSGVAEYEPGLLARAHRGILYVDEVNLLHDHLVDVLLDAAAMGRSTVERDGVSVEHPARFVLVGTMNPEEGELRPQLLDRFGLTVEVAAPRDPATRVEVVRRRIAFEADPTAFAASYADSERALTDRILAAQKLVEEVSLGDAALLKIAEICAAFDVDGMRADIVTARAAVAHAAWHGRTTVGRDDVRAAARLALPHRRRRNPFDAPGIDEDLLDQLLDDFVPDDDPPPQGPDDGSGADSGEGANTEGPDTEAGPTDPTTSCEPGAEATTPQDVPATDSTTSCEPSAEATTPQDGPPEDAPSSGGSDASGRAGRPGGDEQVVPATQPYRPKLFTVPGTGTGESGRRSRAVTSSGRRIGAARPTPGQGGQVHLVETIRAAAPHQVARGRTTGAFRFRAPDLRVATKEGHESNLILFCVDASGSMAARTRMEQVKTAILSLLLDAYQRRDKVGLVTFRGTGAALALPPTHSVDIAATRLHELPAGGRTPLAEGLLEAADLLALERVRDPHRRPLLVVVTDGRATAGPDAVRRSRQVAAHLAAQGVASLVVDCEVGRFRMGLAETLAGELAAEYVPVGEVSASALTGAVRGSLARPDLRAEDGVA